MNLGNELVACALRESSLREFIEAGLTREYLVNESGQDPSHSAFFAGQDRDAWLDLLDHYDRYGKAPELSMFRRSFPAETYGLPQSNATADELVGYWRKYRQDFLMQVVSASIGTLVGEGKIDEAVALLASSHRTVTSVQENPSIVVDWDSKEYDVEARINREIKHGVMTGVPGLDTQFYGFQPGNLICYLGRAKAGKTSFALLSALGAWLEGKRVLFVSFEIAAGKLPSEPGIADRLDCFGAGVDLTKYMMGELNRQEKQQLRDFRDTCGDEHAFRIVQPTSRYTITELEADIEKSRPDVVYIDGFYFMTDRVTGKPGSHWEGHDNLANELKRVGMNGAIPIVLTHQVREKQLTGKRGAGIDDSAMMGGTAIIMYADLVLGVDVDDQHVRTVSCTRSRLKYLDTIKGTWNWDDCTFHEQAPSFDAGQFGAVTGVLEDAE